MPTNLKSLLSRSRSRNELKLREKEENCCEQSTNGSNEGGIGGSSGPAPGPACANGNSSKSSFVGYQCQCTCHRTSGDVCSLSQNKSGGSGSGSGESASGMRKDASCKTLFFSCGTLNGVGDVGIFESGVLCSASGSSSSGLGASGSTASTTHHQDPYSSPSHQSLSMMRKCETVLALSTLAGNVPPGLGTTAAAQTPISPSHSFTTTYSGSACVSNCPIPPTTTAASTNGNNTTTHHNSSSNSTSANNSNATKVSRVMKDKIFSTSSSTLNCLLHSSKTTSKLFSGWKLSSSSNANTRTNAGGSGSTPYSSSSSNSGAGSSNSNSASGGGNNGSPGASDNLSDQYSRANGNSQNSINFSCINTISSSPAATSICQKSRSQLSVSTEAPNGSGLGGSGAPLTPINRLRRNISVSNTNALCPNSLTNSTYSRSSSVTSFVWNKEDQQLQEILCRLCLCNVSFEDTVEILACACRYCKDCVVAYVSFEIQEGAYDIACPDASCEKQGVLASAEIENLVSATLMEKYRKFRMYREVEKDGQLMWCPSPGCETVCRIQETSGLSSGSDSKARSGGSSRSCSLPNISCTSCHKSYCAECKLSWHPDTSCEAFRRKLVKQGKLNLDDEDLFSLESIKKCPFCHVPIEKDSGCAQMMRKRCKHVFCWYCLASLYDDFLLRHYDKGPCKNKLGHSRASVVWHRAQVIGIFDGFGVLVLLASPLLILAAPCLLCCRCRYCANKLDPDESPVPV